MLYVVSYKIMCYAYSFVRVEVISPLGCVDFNITGGTTLDVYLAAMI